MLLPTAMPFQLLGLAPRLVRFEHLEGLLPW